MKIRLLLIPIISLWISQSICFCYEVTDAEICDIEEYEENFCHVGFVLRVTSTSQNYPHHDGALGIISAPKSPGMATGSLHAHRFFLDINLHAWELEPPDVVTEVLLSTLMKPTL
jgi:hypothetical protein